MCITHCVTGFMFMGRIMTVKQGNCQGSVVTKFTVSKTSRASLCFFDGANKERETFTMIFFKLLVIFVVVDIGLVVPETIQTKYNSTHFIAHMCFGIRKTSPVLLATRTIPIQNEHCLKNAKYGCACANEEIHQNSSVFTSLRFISK